MGKTLKFSKETLLTIDRAARRNAEIETGFSTFKHKVHKSNKDYNRKEAKRINWND